MAPAQGIISLLPSRLFNPPLLPLGKLPLLLVCCWKFEGAGIHGKLLEFPIVHGVTIARATCAHPPLSP